MNLLLLLFLLGHHRPPELPWEIASRPQLFKRWIVLSSGYISIQWIVQSVFLILIHWIVIYPMDSAIQRLNNRGQVFIDPTFSGIFVCGPLWLKSLGLCRGGGGRDGYKSN